MRMSMPRKHVQYETRTRFSYLYFYQLPFQKARNSGSDTSLYGAKHVQYETQTRFSYLYFYQLPFQEARNSGSDTSLYGACRGPERTRNKLQSEQATRRGILGYLCRLLGGGGGGVAEFLSSFFYGVKSDVIMGLNVADVTSPKLA